MKNIELTSREQNMIACLPAFVSVQFDKATWTRILDLIEENPAKAQTLLVYALCEKGERQIAKNTADYMRKAQNV